MLFTKRREAIHLEFDKAKSATGLSVVYDEAPDVSSRLAIVGGPRPLGISFAPDRIDEAHILYMESTEILISRAQIGESPESIFAVLELLLEKYR